MNKQDQLRAILRDIQEVRGLSWYEAKQYACGLLIWSPCTLDKYLSGSGQVISDRMLRLLILEWTAEKSGFKVSKDFLFLDPSLSNI